MSDCQTPPAEHDIFHPNLLRPMATNNPLPGQHNLPPPPVVAGLRLKEKDRAELIEKRSHARVGTGKGLVFRIWFSKSHVHARNVENCYAGCDRAKFAAGYPILYDAQQIVEFWIMRSTRERLRHIFIILFNTANRCRTQLAERFFEIPT